jgi:ATP/ADP translocase
MYIHSTSLDGTVVMAKTVKKKNIRTAKTTTESPFGIYWNKGNYFFLFLGFVLLIIGFFVMSLGNWDSTPSLFISPIILIIAYMLIFPAAVFFRKRESSQTTSMNADSHKTEQIDSTKK